MRCVLCERKCPLARIEIFALYCTMLSQPYSSVMPLHGRGYAFLYPVIYPLGDLKH